MCVFTLTKGETEKTFIYRAVKKEELSACLSLQETIVSAIADRALFEPLTVEELSESVEADSVTALFDGDRIAAFSMLIHNRDTDRSLADDARLPRKDVFTFDGVLVSPDYRGYKMQRLFLSLAEKKAKEAGAGHLLATVAPGNVHSRKNFEAAGFCVIREYKKYGGYPRLLVHKEIK